MFLFTLLLVIAQFLIEISIIKHKCEKWKALYQEQLLCLSPWAVCSICVKVSIFAFKIYLYH